MKKLKVHFVVALITFAIGVGTVAAWLAFRHPSKERARNGNSVLPVSSVVNVGSELTFTHSVSQPTGTFPSELNFIQKMKSEQMEFYSIEASYPQLVDLRIKNAQKFNEVIEQLVLKEVAEYQRYKKVEAQKDKDESKYLSEFDITY